MKHCARWVLLLAVIGILSPGMARSADYWVARRGMDREARRRADESLGLTAICG